MCRNRGVPLYTEVSSFQGVGIEESHCIPEVSSISGCRNRGVPTVYRGVLISGVVGIEESTVYRGVLIQGVVIE